VQLSTTNVTSQSNIDTARAARDTAQAQVSAAEANLKIAQLNLSYTSVAAPFDGIVTAHQAEVGALVSHGSPTQLATIVQLNPINVTFNLSENDLLQIRRDLRERGLTVQGLGPITVEVGTTIDKGYPQRGTLDYIAPQVDPRTGTLALRAVVQNGDVSLLPGIFVRVRIPAEVVKNAVLVPAAAIGSDQQGSYVIVVDDKKLAQQRHVTTSAGPGGFEVIDRGLKAEESVVVGGLDRAIPGSALAPKETTLTAPPADVAPATPNR
jgi:multidrug efflux system membrane fusion protein